MLQIIHFIVYVSITVPLVLREFFRILSFANGSMFPNLMEFFIEDVQVSQPERFVEEEAATNFLLSSGDVWTGVGILILTYGASFLITLIFPRSKRGKNVWNEMKYAAWVRLPIEAYLDMCLSI